MLDLSEFSHSTTHPLAPPQADALAAIYRDYAPMLRAAAGRVVGSSDAAEDIVHDVFLRLPRIIAQYRGAGFGGWLKQVTTRQALMYLRASKTRREEAIDDALASDLADCSRNEGDRLLAHEELEHALRRLPVALRRVVILRALHGYSHAEIGRRLGISAVASEVRFSRALKAMRQALAPLDSHDSRVSRERLELSRAS